MDRDRLEKNTPKKSMLLSQGIKISHRNVVKILQLKTIKVTQVMWNVLGAITDWL